MLWGMTVINMTALGEEVTVGVGKVLMGDRLVQWIAGVDQALIMVEHGAQSMIGTMVQHMNVTGALNMADIAGGYLILKGFMLFLYLEEFGALSNTFLNFSCLWFFLDIFLVNLSSNSRSPVRRSRTWRPFELKGTCAHKSNMSFAGCLQSFRIINAQK